jgi:uncharacterized membrane protein (DUF441 family)
MLVNHLKRKGELSEEKAFKFGVVIIVIGLLSGLAQSILSRFFSEYRVSDFMEGFLTVIFIISMVAGVTIVVKLKTKQNHDN